MPKSREEIKKSMTAETAINAYFYNYCKQKFGTYNPDQWVWYVKFESQLDKTQIERGRV